MAQKIDNIGALIPFIAEETGVSPAVVDKVLYVTKKKIAEQLKGGNGFTIVGLVSFRHATVKGRTYEINGKVTDVPDHDVIKARVSKTLYKEAK